MRRPSVSTSIAYVLVCFWTLVCVLPQVFAPVELFANHPPLLSVGESADEGPTHLLGTNHLGHDIYAYLIWSGRQTLLMAAIILSMTYLFLVCLVAPVVVGAVYGSSLVRGVCSLGVYVFRGMPVIVAIILLTGVFPAAYGVAIAIAIGSGAGMHSLVSDYRNQGYDPFRGPISLRAFGRLVWPDFLEKSRLTLALLLTLEFLGLLFESGLGYRISESQSLMLTHPQALLPYLLGVVSMLMAIELLSNQARRLGGTLLSNEDRSIAI